MGKNIFEEVEGHSAVPTSKESTKVDSNSEVLVNPNSTSDEINFNSLPDVGVGDMKKYERQDLQGKTVKIVSAKMFNANPKTDELLTALSNKETKYYKTKFILTYDSENKDGLKDREYLSGALQFLQKDGSISQPLLWFEGADSQVAELFEKVAKFKGIEPKKLSPREFMNFLNSGPSAELYSKEVIYLKQKYHKNMVKEFVK